MKLLYFNKYMAIYGLQETLKTIEYKQFTCNKQNK